MAKATEQQQSEVIISAQADDLARDRVAFNYASDLLHDYGREDYTIWPQPNELVGRIAMGLASLDELVMDDLNLLAKGYHFEDQARFVKHHQDLPLLCEVLGNEPCLGDDCPFYLDADETEHGIGLCQEYKFTFPKNQPSKPDNLTVLEDKPVSESDVSLASGVIQHFDSLKIAQLAIPIEAYVSWVKNGSPDGGISEGEVEATASAVIKLEALYETTLMSPSDAYYAEGRLIFFRDITDH